MYDAVKKITDEMKANETSGYIQAVGKMLLGYLEAHPEASIRIMAENKTIKNSLAEMRKVASEKKSDNVAVLTDQEGFAVVLRYFDIEGEPLLGLDNYKSAPVPQKPARFDVSLEDLL